MGSLDDSRTILHVDMDAFFAAVEMRDKPELRGKPILVGGAGNHGVVSTASYEARVFGCHSAMPMARARVLCPHAIVVRVDMARYAAVSDEVFSIFERFTSQIQSISVDEAFLDVTGSARLFGDGPTIARAIRAAIRHELSLTASVGVAPNKFLAKLASDLEKPDGLTVITRETVDIILPPLAVGRIWGVGKKTAARLNGLGIKTIGDLRKHDPQWFDQHLGSWGQRVRELIHGIDERPVESDGQAKSIGHEQTFGTHLIEKADVRHVLLQQAEAVGLRIRRQKFFASRVSIKIRFGNFQTITRARTLPNPTDATRDIYEAAAGLFELWADKAFQPVRLIGLQSSQFTQQPQLDLFNQSHTERQHNVDRAVDSIKNRFGTAAIHRGRAPQ